MRVVMGGLCCGEGGSGCGVMRDMVSMVWVGEKLMDVKDIVW